MLHTEKKAFQISADIVKLFLKIQLSSLYLVKFISARSQSIQNLISLSNKKRNLNSNNKKNQRKKLQKSNQRRKRKKKSHPGKIYCLNQLLISLTTKLLLSMLRIRKKLFNNFGLNGITMVSHSGMYIIKNTMVRVSNFTLPTIL